jgi:DNA-binding CsgD family transcriptional regulator/tetratricopeptide (TPR) repeat protein
VEQVEDRRSDVPRSVWPTVGRERSLERALRALEPGGGAVALVGPAGVGKTHLARSVLSAATRRGLQTEWVQATEASGAIPLGAFAPLLPHTSVTTPTELLRSAVMELQSRSRHRRLLLVVDDAQLLDPASATLVQQVASLGEIHVVVTVRSGHVVPDAIVSIWKDGIGDRIDLEALVAADVERLLSAALDGDVDGATCHRLWTATQGNPLFLHELVVAGLRSGSLERRDGRWRWRGRLTADVALRDVLESRLSPLAAADRAALELLAIGEPLGVDVYERLVGIEAVDRLERLELVRMTRTERRESASLVHPLYRDVLRGAMSAERAAEVRASLAEAVEAAGGRRRGDLLQVALWRVEADGDLDTDAIARAATEAESRFDFVLAERLARAAVDAGGGPRSWDALASSLRAQGRNREADDAWASALDGDLDTATRAALAQARSANLFFGLGAGGRAIEVLDELGVDELDRSQRDTISSLVAMYDLYRGRVDAALATSAPILERGDVPASARIDAALTASAGLALRGRSTDAIRVVDANIALALSDAAVGSIAAGALMVSRVMALAHDARFQEASEAAQVVYELAVDMGTDDGVAGLSYAIGQLQAMLGDVDVATKRLLEAVDLLRAHDRNGYLPWALAELAYVHLVAGRTDAAAGVLDEIEGVLLPDLRLFLPRVESARALHDAVRGDPEGALDHLHDAAERAVADGSLVLAARALRDGIRCGGAEQVAGKLGRLAMGTDSGFVRLLAGHARAAAAGDGPALLAASEAYERAGALLDAAEAAAEAAAVLADASAAVERLAATERATSLLARCPGAAPPWLVLGPTPPALSKREREVAELAAEGLTSKEIAARLYLSVRTVDNHLHRVYAKVGVQRREELQRVVDRDVPRN